ncbi:type IV toxin-antitoxin system AbiEi family antitoxin [Solirubrobacter phytolaccae]|uniref:Type IV toxin-antitoxin system AbiEi family antitoxin n=1 Tax=Solirubrobacter phytolaccae TaxID=1404360 RepID=A0A9X3N5S4_9ACTN|nr:type IV toxin-antitoxin system AbiEi family antitoxin [Solirubrobacter phytolaccae]MDA0178852.1 type IV toxin-antitoxin system AbiEi family antitoxin [Solirubrobacter phytolaccae]
MSQVDHFAKSSGLAFEREAARRIPELLADLLDEPVSRFEHAPDGGVDVVARDDRDRVWAFQVKNSGGPGAVTSASERLAAAPDAIPVLVVPYMTPAGARTAAERNINWLDLAGNASIRAENLYLSREGRPSVFKTPGRPSSPFAPKSARITRALLQDPRRWWRQKGLAEVTGLDDGSVSRTVRRLDQEQLLERDGHTLRPADPDTLLDAWTDAYRFDAHDVIVGHASGSGIELTRDLSQRLRELGIAHAATGLPAAWLLDRFATFRISTIYVDGDPRDAADRLEIRRNERGANVQLVGPNDAAVMAFRREIDGVPIVSPVQAYLDLRALPERASEAAEHLREQRLLWPE